MTIQKYHIIIVDRFTGQIYLDVTTKDVDLASSSVFHEYMDRYLNILRSIPSVCLDICPIRSEYKEGLLSV